MILYMLRQQFRFGSDNSLMKWTSGMAMWQNYIFMCTLKLFRQVQHILFAYSNEWINKFNLPIHTNIPRSAILGTFY